MPGQTPQEMFAFYTQDLGYDPKTAKMIVELNASGLSPELAEVAATDVMGLNRGAADKAAPKSDEKSAWDKYTKEHPYLATTKKLLVTGARGVKDVASDLVRPLDFPGMIEKEKAIQALKAPSVPPTPDQMAKATTVSEFKPGMTMLPNQAGVDIPMDKNTAARQRVKNEEEAAAHMLRQLTYDLDRHRVESGRKEMLKQAAVDPSKLSDIQYLALLHQGRQMAAQDQGFINHNRPATPEERVKTFSNFMPGDVIPDSQRGLLKRNQLDALYPPEPEPPIPQIQAPFTPPRY
jgi:hypothetical protein